mmetsp:Transcript_34275/g.101832  ORF Transcript_34275/g.101832 Transcript_34275/m.101832 type:complete len:277 (-) Transcript_34275:185-1015(-)
MSRSVDMLALSTLPSPVFPSSTVDQTRTPTPTLRKPYAVTKAKTMSTPAANGREAISGLTTLEAQPSIVASCSSVSIEREVEPKYSLLSKPGVCWMPSLSTSPAAAPPMPYMTQSRSRKNQLSAFQAWASPISTSQRSVRGRQRAASLWIRHHRTVRSTLNLQSHGLIPMKVSTMAERPSPISKRFARPPARNGLKKQTPKARVSRFFHARFLRSKPSTRSFQKTSHRYRPQTRSRIVWKIGGGSRLSLKSSSSPTARAFTRTATSMVSAKTALSL